MIDKQETARHNPAPFVGSCPLAPGYIDTDEVIVANTAQAKKRARQAEKHRQLNVTLRSRLRTAVKKVLIAIKGGQKSAAEASYKDAVPVIDSMVNKNIIHRNKAARHKSRLNQHIKSMQ